MSQAWTEQLYSTAVNFQYGVSRERSSCTFGINLHLLNYSREACSYSVFLQVCPFELAQQLNDECFYWGGISLSTACALDACCTFSEIAKYPSQVLAGVIAYRPVQRLGGGRDVTKLSPFLEETTRK